MHQFTVSGTEVSCEPGLTAGFVYTRNERVNDGKIVPVSDSASSSVTAVIVRKLVFFRIEKQKNYINRVFFSLEEKLLTFKFQDSDKNDQYRFRCAHESVW